MNIHVRFPDHVRFFKLWPNRENVLVSCVFLYSFVFQGLLFQAFLLDHRSLMWLVEILLCIVCDGTSQILKTLIHIQRTTAEIINFRKRDHVDNFFRERLKIYKMDVQEVSLSISGVSAL